MQARDGFRQEIRTAGLVTAELNVVTTRIEKSRESTMLLALPQGSLEEHGVAGVPFLLGSGCHDLTLGKIYEMIGVEGKGSFYRIVDDSGEDFLYPVSHFRVV